MLPHLDTVCVIHDLERQHRLAEASRAHRLGATIPTSRLGLRMPAGVWRLATGVRRLTGMIRLRPHAQLGLTPGGRCPSPPHLQPGL
jgi:hypothetical protein